MTQPWEFLQICAQCGWGTAWKKISKIIVDLNSTINSCVWLMAPVLTLLSCNSMYGLWNSSIVFLWSVLEIQNLRSHPRPTESECSSLAKRPVNLYAY